MGFSIASFAMQRRIRRFIRFVCAGMYLYSAALGIVVGLNESRRHGAGLESPGVEDMHDPGYGLLRIPLPRTRVNRGAGLALGAEVLRGGDREVLVGIPRVDVVGAP